MKDKWKVKRNLEIENSNISFIIFSISKFMNLFFENQDWSVNCDLHNSIIPKI